MKVALVIERIETWRGGAETSTVQFAGHLARQGCEVHVITATNIPSTPDMHIVPIPARSWFRAGKTLVFSRQAADYLHGRDYDIVHCITPCMAADIYQPRGGTVPETLQRNLAIRSSAVMRLGKRLGQATSLKYRIMADMERELLTRRPTPWVISISDYVTGQLERHYDFDGRFVRKIFNGVDPDETPADVQQAQRAEIRKQYGLGEEDFVLLCVAHNFKLKGVGKAIEALGHLQYGRTRETADRERAQRAFLIVAGRDNPRKFAALAQRLGVARYVHFAGPTQRVQAYFHAADVLVHPTFYDPCSRVALEALACGLPVITTRYNGAAERIENGRQGYVIDSPLDVAALADAMARLTHEEHRRACAAKAPSALDGIRMEDHARHALALYRELVADGGLRQGGYR